MACLPFQLDANVPTLWLYCPRAQTTIQRRQLVTATRGILSNRGIDLAQELVMDLWTSLSNSGKQILLSVGCAVAGLVLVIGFREFRASSTNAMAGFFFWVLLLPVGVASCLLSGRQIVVVDSAARRITVEELNRFRPKSRSIAFGDIERICIGYLWKRSNCVTWYYLVLRLRNGEEYPLFAPGRLFEGGSDKSIVASWKQRLEEYVGQ